MRAQGRTEIGSPADELTGVASELASDARDQSLREKRRPVIVPGSMARRWALTPGAKRVGAGPAHCPGDVLKRIRGVDPNALHHWPRTHARRGVAQVEGDARPWRLRRLVPRPVRNVMTPARHVEGKDQRVRLGKERGAAGIMGIEKVQTTRFRRLARGSSACCLHPTEQSPSSHQAGAWLAARWHQEGRPPPGPPFGGRTLGVRPCHQPPLEPV